jgi:hypothetical protein
MRERGPTSPGVRQSMRPNSSKVGGAGAHPRPAHRPHSASPTGVSERDSGDFAIDAPGQRFHDRTDSEMCFDSLDAAVAAGFPAIPAMAKWSKSDTA